MLSLKRNATTITVETAGGILAWDAGRGGQITEFTVKNELASHRLLPPGSVLPDLQWIVDKQPVRLADCRAVLKVVEEEPDSVRISARNVLFDGALIITLEYEIHEEGVLFCNLYSEIPAAASFDLGGCSMRVGLHLDNAGQMRWGHYMRAYSFKRDFTSIHALPAFKGFLKSADRSEAAELFPLVSLDLGWQETRFFSNHIEFFLEDWTGFHDLPLERTGTSVGIADGLWRIHWHFYKGSVVCLRGSSLYRNRWGLAFGRARSQSGPEADPAVRNNLLGCRICHCKYPYARSGNRWPWVTMPIKQVAEQTPQLFSGNPGVERADEAAALGATFMILHQFWMSNPGSNGEPPADYQPADPAWLRSFTVRCHERGMRVALYVRGTEMWSQFSPFFEDFLNKNRDGLYADWNSPFSMGFVKCSPLHVSLYAYFHFMKTMRRRVGSAGIIVGHAGYTNYLSLACHDAMLGGETSVRHDELLTDPESSAYFAHLDCSGAHFIGGNKGDRAPFASPKAAAMCAALGMTSQVNMEPDIPFSDQVAFIKPLWDAMASLPGRIVRLHNPAYIPTRAVRTGAPWLYPSLWQNDRGQALLLITNMGAESQSGAVEICPGELDVAKNSVIRPLAVKGTFGAAVVDGQTVRVDNMPPLKYAALLIGGNP